MANYSLAGGVDADADADVDDEDDPTMKNDF